MAWYIRRKDDLLKLNMEVENALEKQGFLRKVRISNVILLRRVKKSKKLFYEKFLNKIELEDFAKQRIEHIALMKSTLYPTGPVYEILEQYLLKK
jgi:2'-5' RNA ligase